MTMTACFVSREREIHFRDPREVLCARTTSEIRPALERIDQCVESGAHAAGFIAYEAAPAFDPALATHPPTDLPLLWFGLYDRADEQPAPGRADTDRPAAFEVGEWRPLVAEPEYRAAIGRIRDYIAAGDTYQVNYTFPLEAPFHGDPRAWFRTLCRAQNADYCAFIDAGRFQILSASPELFFRLDRDRLVTRPMKGTRWRGLWPDDDRRLAQELAASAKDRAENAMIVDLLRNDVGRVSTIGSVRVESVFDVERYETVWQMTSTVASRTAASVPEILAALFPSGSVTGAPKIRTMQIIRELEPQARGVYCGAVGWWAAGRRAEFNVAIRTVVVDSATRLAGYGVGGGITWDSTPEGEYDECRAKCAVLSAASRGDFQLLESILFDGEYFLLAEHLDRLAASAEYFGFRIDRAAVAAALRARAADLAAQLRALAPGAPGLKVRLLLSRDGSLDLSADPLPPPHAFRVALAREPVDPSDLFLYHKTTRREVYDRHKAARPDCDEVLLWNPRGELTEGTFTNVVLELGGELLTPPVRCGLLGGVMRAHLLKAGRIREAVLTRADLSRASRILLINSVRKWIDTALVP